MSKKCGKHMQCQYVPWSEARLHLDIIEAVIFRPFYFNMKSEFEPIPHPSHQKWVFFEEEAPYRTWKKWNYHFDVWKEINVTVTFTDDADLMHYNLGITCSKNLAWKPSGQNYAKEKGKGILWMVNNCHHTSGREYYVQELQKYIKVDIYGKCGNGSICSKNKHYDIGCQNKLIREYKFYLAFENSFCEEYYTEKIGKLRNIDVLPIVMGLVNYTRLLSPGTFIDVRDFSSPQALAKYLHYLSINDTAYNAYIEHRRMVKCGPKFRTPLICKLCNYLHQHREETQLGRDAREFWGVKSKCKTPEQFFQGVADPIIRNISRIDYRV